MIEEGGSGRAAEEGLGAGSNGREPTQAANGPGSGRGNRRRDRSGHKPPRRGARLRERWRNASLKTSFMVYMLSFLLAALVLSISTGALFGDLQNQATADAYEVSGLYLYDKDADDLVPARTVEVSMDGSTVLVQTVRNGMASIARVDLPAGTGVMDASDYAYSAGDLESDSLGPDYSETSIEENFGSDLSISNLPSYDAWARDQFDRWLAENPASPYASFFPSGSADGLASTEGLMVSAVGYYLNTPPSPEAEALSAAFGLLSFLMFPLWFGVCIFAAARRFYRMRLAPGLAVLDDAAAKIASQDLVFTVSYDRGNELGRLARSFEDMRASLAASQRALWRTAEERKRLNAAFAHDLRTPLTVLKGKVELLEARLQSDDPAPEQLEASARSLASQVERLERYVEAMSGLQKLEDREAVRARLPFDTVAGDVDSTGTALCGEAGVAFELFVSAENARSGFDVVVDRAIVEETAGNLVGNAARYAASKVTARLEVRDGMLALFVEDDGPGFSPEALEYGCAPFFSERKDAVHFGLGLNIAATLCERHGGTLELRNGPRGGACVVARFAVDG